MYFIAIIPPEKISEEIRYFKQEALEKYGVKSSLKSQAHITLVPPFHSDRDELKENMERLKKFLTNYEPFKINLENFSCFGERTIYVEVVRDEKLLNFYLDMKNSCQEVFKFDSRQFYPHITLINRDIPEGKFQEIWEEYSGREYRRVFSGDTVALFIYREGRWEIEERIKLLPLL